MNEIKTNELEKLARLFNTENVMTSEDVKEILRGVVTIMNECKVENEKMIDAKLAKFKKDMDADD